MWFNASTATIYRHAMDRPNTETAGELGEGFSVDVARNWEREFFEGDLPHTRRVALRMAIVLGDGPATNTLLTLARIGLGGPQIDGWWFPHRRYRGIGPTPTGNGRSPWHRTKGRQKFSWVHIDDVVGAIRFLRDRDDIAGPVNIASPHPADNRTLMRTLRAAVGMRIGLPAWRWMLEPAMWLLRTEPELILKSRWVVPETLAAAGYRFEHPDLQEAVATTVASTQGARAPADIIDADDAGQSVYQRALGEDFASLDPRLQRYFGPIPPGSVGTGSGIYEVAGSRLRVLRPLFALMARRHVLFPELGRDVPFAVTNTPGLDGSLSASRTFEFQGRTRVMEDTMSVVNGQLVDRVGKRRGLEVTIHVTVVAGALHMESTRLAVRAGRARIPLPPLVTLHLRESIDHVVPSRQHVDVRLTAPLIGEVFRYTGTFTYEVDPHRRTARANPPAAERTAPIVFAVMRVLKHKAPVDASH